MRRRACGEPFEIGANRRLLIIDTPQVFERQCRDLSNWKSRFAIPEIGWRRMPVDWLRRLRRKTFKRIGNPRQNVLLGIHFDQPASFSLGSV